MEFLSLAGTFLRNQAINLYDAAKYTSYIGNGLVISTLAASAFMPDTQQTSKLLFTSTVCCVSSLSLNMIFSGIAEFLDFSANKIDYLGNLVDSIIGYEFNHGENTASVEYEL